MAKKKSAEIGKNEKLGGYDESYYKNKLDEVNSQLVDLAETLDETVKSIYKLTCDKAFLIQTIRNTCVRESSVIFFDDLIDHECMERIHKFVNIYKGR